MDPTSPEVQAELARKHKAAARTVLGLLVGTLLLAIIAFLGRPYFIQEPNPPLDMGVRITILILGLGAVVWRRSKFGKLRLQDIAGLQGPSGLIRTLERTTLQLALIAATIAVIGFMATLTMGADTYTYWAGAISVVILLYSYPTKSSWLRALYHFTAPQT